MVTHFITFPTVLEVTSKTTSNNVTADINNNSKITYDNKNMNSKLSDIQKC